MSVAAPSPARHLSHRVASAKPGAASVTPEFWPHDTLTLSIDASANEPTPSSRNPAAYRRSSTGFGPGKRDPRADGEVHAGEPGSRRAVLADLRDQPSPDGDGRQRAPIPRGQRPGTLSLQALAGRDGEAAHRRPDGPRAPRPGACVVG